jgi:hypothetical protein
MKVAPMAISESTESNKKFHINDVNCLFTIKTCAFLTLDAFLCLPCCCFCGGCCGRFEPCIANMFPNDINSKPGGERCHTVCTVQCFSGILMPLSFCGCFWGFCGICTPCTKCLAQCMISVEKQNNKITPPVQVAEMTR